MTKDSLNPSHFKGKEAVEHVVEAQAKGLASKAEFHGEETPGHISAAVESIRETSLLTVLLWTLFWPLGTPTQMITMLSVFMIGWTVWRAGRSAHLGWARLERLHRMVAEEKWEIDHHREQEREELAALYEAKGFKGKLLEDVLDVLMSNSDLLLRVMIEEELGLTLEKQEHPLKQALGAALGTVAAFLVMMLGYFLIPSFGIPLFALLVTALAAGVLAKYSRNHATSAVLWSMSLIIVAWSTTYFTWQFLKQFHG